MPRRVNSSVLWDVFDKIDLREQKAKCRQCGDIYSYKSSTANLKVHLKRKHPDSYDRVSKAQKARESRVIRDNEESGSNVKFSSEIWRQFDHDDDEAKCNICQEAVQKTIDDMKNHLEEHHTSVLDDIIAKAQKGLDSDDADDENVYTEIVYLEDETRNRNSSPRKRRKSRYEETSKFRSKRERRVSEQSSSDEVLKKPKESTPDDLEVFVTYIRSLLKKVPKEVAPKLHLDIINLIMNATIKAHNQIVIETLDDTNINTQNTRRLITVPIHNLMKGNESANVMPPLYVTSNVKYTSANTVLDISGQGDTSSEKPSKSDT